MNQLMFKVSSLFMAVVLCSCGSSDKDEPKEPVPTVTITVNPSEVKSGYEASTQEIAVTSTADWSIRSDADWCVVTPSGGVKNQTSTVKVKLSANNTGSTRTCKLVVTSSGKVSNVSVTQSSSPVLNVSMESISFGAQKSSFNVTIDTNESWTAESNASWCGVSPGKGEAGNTSIAITAEPNSTNASREAVVTVKSTSLSKTIKINQYTDEITAPEGYTLVWHDEFNEGKIPGSDWTAENWAAGHVNNELQTYTDKTIDGKRTLEIVDGILNINCFKGSDGKIYSGRINARPSTGWLYGYFEARILLPKGKGTWPAFWMMPSNVDWNKNPWPYCGEIDIMEEVGANPEYVSSSLHTGNYNHTKGTQKTHEMKCPGAESEYHIYSCEWTPTEIITYVDGKVQLRATKASMGADHDSWPFTYAFYPILNLAWGGDWGGYKGVDESALPCTMKIDYVRIFQKNQ